MAIVIRAENIGKLYRINHEAQGRQFRYESLGETLANVGKSIWRGITHPGRREGTRHSEEDFWALQDITMKSSKAIGWESLDAMVRANPPVPPFAKGGLGGICRG